MLARQAGFVVKGMLLGCFIVGIADTAFADSLLSQLSRRTTLVDSNGVGEAGQDLQGYWFYQDAEEGPQLFRLSGVEDGYFVFHNGINPKAHPGLHTGQRNLLSDNFSGVWGQFKQRGDCLVGLSTSAEKRIPGRPLRCPNYKWWDRSQACFASNGLRNGELAVQGFRHEAPECTQDTSSPENRSTKLRRFVGASFAPVSQGRYIHLVAVAAPQGYRAMTRVAWDYLPIQKLTGRPLIVSIESVAASTIAHLPLSGLPVFGHKDIVTEKSGQMRLQVIVRTDQGQILHVDNLSVAFPRVPGLN